MAWVKLDDQFHDHPKVLEVGPLGECLYVRGLAYAARYLTDGFIPAAHLRRMGDMDAIEEAAKLVDAGLWDAVDKGYQVHDYLDYQPSAEKVKADRESARQRMGKARAGKQKPNTEMRSDEVPPNFARSSDNPVPSRPLPDQEVPGGTSGSHAGAREDGADAPDRPHAVPKPAKANVIEQRFQAFWSAYPNKTGKGAARAKFHKIKPSAEFAGKLIAAVEAQKQSARWREDGGKYIPNPATWLNQERWDDELPTPTNLPNGSRASPGDGHKSRATLDQLQREIDAGLYDDAPAAIETTGRVT